MTDVAFLQKWSNLGLNSLFLIACRKFTYPLLVSGMLIISIKKLFFEIKIIYPTIALQIHRSSVIGLNKNST